MLLQKKTSFTRLTRLILTRLTRLILTRLTRLITLLI